MKAAPCVAWNHEHEHCVAGLLHGVACCPDGGCLLCTAQADWMRGAGFTDYAIVRSLTRLRRGMLDACPICGFPPPPAITAKVGSSRVDLQACKLEYSIVSPK